MKKKSCIALIALFALAITGAAAQQTGKPAIKLNKPLYGKGDVISAAVTFGVIAPMYKQYIVFVSPETGDMEYLDLVNASSQKLSTAGSLKILIGLRPVKNDGTLTVKAGGKVYAYYYKKDLNGAHPNTVITKSKPDIALTSADVIKSL